MNTKHVLMLVILSGGMLTGLTATMIQAATVYADTGDCKDNGDHNCNASDRDLKIEQENNCRVEHGGADANGGDAKDDSGDGGAGGSSSGNDNAFTCSNDVIQPNTGNDAFNGLIQGEVVAPTSNDVFAAIG
jgi:hypothetical protein